MLQHASLELGTVSTPSDAAARASAVPLADRPHVAPQLGHCMAPSDIEDRVRATSSASAPGPDNIPNSLIQAQIPEVARALFPFFLMQSLYCDEPWQHKGGRMVHIWKRRGLAEDPDTFRGVLVSVAIGKLGRSHM